MKKSAYALFVMLGVVLGAGSPVSAAEKEQAGAPAAMALQSATEGVDKLAETFFAGCEKELNSYCKDVVPGEGRLLACLYAHSDKISSRCEYAVYDAAAQLEHYLTTVVYLASECADDLETYCANTQVGEGRLADCLDKNRAKISKRCSKALKDVGKK